jgi:hypothetical protein
MKVCVEPDLEASDAGIFMRSLDSFTFARSDVTPVIYQPAGMSLVRQNSFINFLRICYMQSTLFVLVLERVGVVLTLTLTLTGGFWSSWFGSLPRSIDVHGIILTGAFGFALL